MNTMAIDRIANCYRCLGEFDVAEQFVGDAIAEALRAGDKQTLAFAYFTRASNVLDQSISVDGIDDLKRSFLADRDAAATASVPTNPTLGVNALIKLADAYYQSGRYDKAGRVALAARDLSRRLEVASGEAYSEVLLGLVDEIRGRNDAAVWRWRRVIELSKELRNTRLNFIAEFFVFRQAMYGDNRALARAARLRLERLAPWVPSFLPQLQEFRAMTTADPIDPRAVLRQVSERRG
jgi:tetratricopeptide (TPR) repeat protein